MHGGEQAGQLLLLEEFKKFNTLQEVKHPQFLGFVSFGKWIPHD
jgi:hypothetical protein